MGLPSLDDLLTLVQTIAIIAALLVTLYFSTRQVRALSVDLESRVLSDINDQFHNLAEAFVRSPELVRIVYQVPGSAETPETPLSYYMMFFYAHIYRMRQRGILGDNEWAGWHQWMRNAFRWGAIAKNWKQQSMGIWFDPAFRDFVERDLMPAATPAGA